MTGSAFADNEATGYTDYYGNFFPGEGSAICNGGSASSLVISNPTGLHSDALWSGGVSGFFLQCTEGYFISEYDSWSPSFGVGCTSPTYTSCSSNYDDGCAQQRSRLRAHGVVERCARCDAQRRRGVQRTRQLPNMARALLR